MPETPTVTPTADAPPPRSVIKKLENATPNWQPLPQVIEPGLNKFFRPYWPKRANGDPELPGGLPAVTRTQGIMGTTPHELRPWERIYYVDGELPEPPPMDDERWRLVKTWFWRTINHGKHDIEPGFDEFTRDVWKDMPESIVTNGGDKADPWRDRDGNFVPRNFEYRKMPAEAQVTLGYWCRGFHDLYWDPAFLRALPDYRYLGATPWGSGHSNDHYAKASWCLENYVVTGDPAAWRMFVLIVLHQAGQGFNFDPGVAARSGHHGLRYEKSPDHWVGSFYPDDRPTWGHFWPEAILLFWYLTGELAEVAQQILLNMRDASPRGYNGYWGPRGNARALRALRLVDHLFPGFHGDDVVVRDIISNSLDLVQQAGLSYFPNYGASNGGIAPWQDWDWLSEAAQYAAFEHDGDELYGRMLPIAQWHLANTTSPDGRIAYGANVIGGNVVSVDYISPTHTAGALPMLGAMVHNGDLPVDTFRRSADVVFAYMPKNRNGGRGILHLKGTNQTRPWGPGGEKIAGSLMFGLRHDILIYVGGYGKGS